MGYMIFKVSFIFETYRQHLYMSHCNKNVDRFSTKKIFLLFIKNFSTIFHKFLFITFNLITHRLFVHCTVWYRTVPLEVFNISVFFLVVWKNSQTQHGIFPVPFPDLLVAARWSSMYWLVSEWQVSEYRTRRPKWRERMRDGL